MTPSDIQSPKPAGRPLPGKTTVRTTRIPICRKCGCVIDDTGLCDGNCPLDGDDHTGCMFYAVYETTTKFIRDEECGEDA